MFDEEYMTEAMWESNMVAQYGSEEEGMWFVIRKCPQCGRVITTGKVFINDEIGHAKFEGWKCSIHGEIEPEWGGI